MNKFRLLIIIYCIVAQYSMHAMYPLHDAASQGDVKEVKRLLDAGFDVNSKNEGGSTPLHTAAHKRQVSAVLLLLNRGADVYAQDDQGNSPQNLSRIGAEFDKAMLVFAGIAPGSVDHLQIFLDAQATINVLKACRRRQQLRAQQAKLTFASILHPRLGEKSHEMLRNQVIVENILRHIRTTDFNEQPLIRHQQTNCLQALFNNKYFQVSAIVGCALLVAYSASYSTI